MELGELVSVAIPGQDSEADCPFSHEKPNPSEKNELGGIGTKLGDNLSAGKGVHTSKPPLGGDFTQCTVEPDPRRGKPPLLCVLIKVKGQTITINGKKPLPYPLTCAAHHLVPAQEALKGNPILKYMCKDGESQDFRSSGGPDPAAVPGAKVWGNVAYNVNGGQNGVWLPGNYAVGAGAGGVGIWKSGGNKHTTLSNEQEETWARTLDLGPDEWRQNYIDPVEEEGPQPGAAATAATTSARPVFLLAGTNYHIDDNNPKWAYVKAAMDSAGGLFHDRHKSYSDEVATYLKKIAEAYAAMYDRSTDPKTKCKKCEDAERPDGASASLVGPPYGIVSRLVVSANFFKKYVKSQSVTAKNIYTSKWVLAWMEKK